MTFVKFATKYLPLLPIAMLVLLVRTLRPGDREGRSTSLLFFNSTTFQDVVDKHNFNTSAAPSLINKVSMDKVTQGTNDSGCIPTLTREKSAYDRQRVQEEQQKRRAHLQEVCFSEIINSKATELNPKHFLIDRNRQIIYCWIHKVASTSWISFMARLRGLRVRTKWIYREISRLSATSSEEVQAAALDYHVRFIVVRHPFLRLISAYRDRIWAATQKYSAQALTHVPRILRLTRPQLFQFHSSSITHKNSRTLAIVPTFEEFVQYLLVTGNEIHLNKSSKAVFDVHWVPYYQHCSVCSIPFNIIIKLETIEDDKNFMMEELGLKPLEMKETEKIINEPHRWQTENDYNDKISPMKKKLNTMPKPINLPLEQIDNMSKFYSHKPTSEMTKKTKNSRNKTGNKIAETNDSHSVTTKLDHLQISNVGPSCPCYYFSQLTREQLQGLTKIYERDLKIFGYSTEEYKNCLN